MEDWPSWKVGCHGTSDNCFGRSHQYRLGGIREVTLESPQDSEVLPEGVDVLKLSTAGSIFCIKNLVVIWEF